MRARIAGVIVGILAAACLAAAQAADPIVVRDMESASQFTVGQIEIEKQKVPVGTETVVPGKVGKAVQFSFIADARNGFFMTYPSPTPAWDEAAGLSFWVKGDGSGGTGGIELIADENYRMRYAYCFPTRSTEWRKVEIPWSAFIPEHPTVPFFGPGRMKPSSIRALAFGKWYHWGQYPAVTFAIDQIALEPTMRVDRKDYAPRHAGTPRARAKLKAKQPITVVTVGDSLSAKAHWANRELLWSELMVKNLEQQHGSKVTLVNPAVGGTELTQGLVIAPRWLQDYPAPEVITICYGFNDFDDGATPALFKEQLRYVVDSLRRATKGNSEIVLLTTCPAITRWTEMEGLAQAVRDVAHEKKTGLADVAAAFHRVGDKDEAARKDLFAWDAVHLGAAGHRLFAATVQGAIEGQGESAIGN